MIAEAAVRTTGINWESVAVIIGVVVGVMSTVFGIVAKMVGNQVTSAINKFRIEVVNQLDNRLTSVESKVTDIHNRRRLRFT